MILRYIYLYLNPEEFHGELGVQFGFRTRYLCNYIERKLNQLKFQSEGFGKLCLMGTFDSSIKCSVVPENALRVPVCFNASEYLNLSPDERHEYYIKLLTDGLKIANQNFTIPAYEIHESISAFRAGSYINEWVYLSKKTKDRKISASLVCALDEHKFTLRLILKRNFDLILDKQILETKPDEIIFAYRFKSLSINGDELVVVDKFGDVFYKLNLNDI